MRKANQGAAPAAAQEHARGHDWTAKIRALNDRFRQTLTGGRVVVTTGVEALGPARIRSVIARVSNFDVFTADNDPYGEHDFGAFDDGGERFFWKIDYCDPTLTSGSPDPSDPLRTCRVPTVMLAAEY